MDTDLQLAILQSLHPSTPVEDLLNALTKHNGDTKQADHFLKARAKFRINSKSSGQATFKINRTHVAAPKAGTTTHLYGSEEIASEIGYVTLHQDVLPKDLADSLLRGLMSETSSWSRRAFHLFGREVNSPHGSAVYTEVQRQTSYSGRILTDARLFDKNMKDARDIIQRLVNEQINLRGRSIYQTSEWHSDIAVCNSYEGPSDSVGYHSDQLSHLGPECTIAGLSLGVNREFRLKHRHGRQMPTYALHLPHNSVVIMHAGCQERYKHSVVSTSHCTPHPVSGNTRISITFRMYPSAMELSKLPKCSCRQPMILRTTVEKENKPFKYFWMCSQEYIGKPGCKKTIWPSQDELIKYTDEGVKNADDS